MKKHFEPEELARIQVEREIAMKTAGIERFHANNARMIREGSYSDTDWARRIIRELVDPMAQAIDAFIEYYSNRRGRPNIALKYLTLLSSREASFIAIKVIMDCLIKKQAISTVSTALGAKIEDQVRFASLANAAPVYIKKVALSLKKNKSRKYNHRHNVLAHTEDKLATPNPNFETKVTRWKSWPEKDKMHLGSFLIDLCGKHVLFNGEPIIKKVVVTYGNCKREAFIEPSEVIMDWIDRYKEAMEAMSPAFTPCVVQPKDWTSPNNGGYHIEELSGTLPLVKGRKSQVNRLTRKQMPAVYQCVNNLQSVPWRIKDEVLDVLKEVFTNDLGLAIPYTGVRKKAFPDPPIPSEYSELRGDQLKDALTEEEWAQFVEWKRQRRIEYDKESKRKSELLKLHRLISSAEQYRVFEELFFVYTLDFRGRVYCRSDTVSPQGDDIQKSLIEFAEGKPLGKEGYYWLAVHGAGELGKDKIPFDERVALIEAMEDEIRDICCDPYTFKSWVAADKPWQFLSWCFEWNRMLEWRDAGNTIEDFVTRLPIAMDGSCSGIQHYSAILRDPVGGAAVNLVPSPAPRDIYRDVAQVALVKLNSLTRETTDPATILIINTLLSAEGGINRNITKKAVMTLPYGSTFKRCLESISTYFAKLKETEDKLAKVVGRKPNKVINTSTNKGLDGLPMQQSCEVYLAKIVWDSIGEVVVAAREGMKYIQQVASYVAKRGQSLEWVTPTGFIVNQLELDSSKQIVKTQLFGETYLTLKNETKKVLVRRMRTSSAPNFIHSMDASHLTFTVNACMQAGIEHLAVIHDSFGTHACNVPLMRNILRQELVRMYEENDVFKEFHEYNEGLLCEAIPIPLPERMGLDLKVMMNSDYCFA